ETHLARRRVQRHHTHALLESAYARPRLFDHSSQFVPEERRRHNHSRMISALVHLEVCATSERHLHFDQDLSVLNMRNRNPLNFYVLFAIEDGCCHLSVHCYLSCELPG